MGSPLYMSPEQMRSSKDVDARADIWSLGVILYELLTANFPFMGETQAGVCIKIASEPPAPIERVRPDLPAGLRDVILRCLQKDPAWRYANVAALAAGLAPFAPRSALGMIDRIHGIAGGAGKATLDAPFSGPASNLSPITASGQSAPGASHPTSSPMTRTAPASMGGKMGAYGAAGALAVAAVVGLAALKLHAVRPPASAGTPAAGPGSAAAAVPPAAPSAAPSTAPAEPLSTAAVAAPTADVAASEHDAGPAAAPSRKTTPKTRPAAAGAPAVAPAAGEPANAPPADPLQNLNMKR